MPGQELRLGPFIGGLNLFSDPTAIADTEMQSCINYEVGIDGSLVSRLPVTDFSTPMTPAGGMLTRIKILLLAKLNGNFYFIGSTAEGIYQSTGGPWSVLSTNPTVAGADCAVQYNNKVWIFPKSTSSTSGGGTWDGTTFSILGTLPPASNAITFKERTWIVPGPTPGIATNNSRLQFSLVADPSGWNTGDATFIDVNPGDGKNLIDLITYQDNIMLFKEDSTYALAFDSVPTLAAIKKVNNVIGASDKHNVVSFENTIYVLHRNWVYEIVNYNWIRVNVKVPFGSDSHLPNTYNMGDNPYFITLCGDRLIVKLYSKIYVWGMRTRTWTEWKVSETNREHWFGPLVRYPQMFVSGLDGYVSGSMLQNDTKTFVIRDGYTTSTESSVINCTMQTKNFDSAYGRRYRIFSFGQRFKRMFWWGADVITNQPITGIATPISSSFQSAWGSVKVIQWQNLGTWNQPIGFLPAITTTYTNSGLNFRHFAKFAKGLRYRQINFQVNLQTNGDTTTGPAHLFGIINCMEVRELVTKGVS